MKKIIAAALVSGSVLASSAQAAQDGAYLPYVGMDYTYSDANARFERPHYNSGSVNVGTMYNRFFGTEVFYQLSDSHKIRHETDKSKTSFQAYGLDLYGYLPFGCYGTFTLRGIQYDDHIANLQVGVISDHTCQYIRTGTRTLRPENTGNAQA